MAIKVEEAERVQAQVKVNYRGVWPIAAYVYWPIW